MNGTSVPADMGCKRAKLHDNLKANHNYYE